MPVTSWHCLGQGGPLVLLVNSRQFRFLRGQEKVLHYDRLIFGFLLSVESLQG